MAQTYLVEGDNILYLLETGWENGIIHIKRIILRVQKDL